MIYSPTWHEAMRRAAQARHLALGAETLQSRLHLKSMAFFFLEQAAKVRRRDRYLVGAI